MGNRQIELLSPAGDYECFMAAMNAGADAVYLGGDKFGARAYAKNFTEEEIISAIDYAHLFGKKIFMTINTLVKNEELFELSSYLQSFYLAGLDAVIVQDIGVISYIRRNFPGLPVHASTQMAITDIEGVELTKEFGMERVVLARELSLKEIREIHDKTGMELECFIHGALCYCYSGKCLLSSLIGGRSGNRGRCAQPCRLPYNGQYLLSTKDICTLQLLPQLIEAGITSFKIEGRMKNPDYVAGVTGIYRKYIDRYLSNPKNPYLVEQKDLQTLLTLYTRSGNSQGYYNQKNGRDMITIEKPGYQTADEEKRKEVYAFYAGKEKKLPIQLAVSLHAEQPAKLTVTGRQGMGADEQLEITVTGAVVEKAQKQPLSEAAVEKQMRKTGGTPYEIIDLQIRMESDIFIPVGQLNELRRNALQKLKDRLLSNYQRTLPAFNSDCDLASGSKAEKEKQNGKALLHCSITAAEQLEAVLDSSAAVISIPVTLLNRDKALKIEQVSKHVHQMGKQLFLVLPNIIRNRFFDRQKELALLLKSSDIDGAVISNYESLFYLQKISFTKEILADFHLYDWNAEARKTLLALGCSQTTVPVELNKKELLRRGITGEEFILYGRLPMMVSAQCITSTTQGCSHRSQVMELTDRYGTKFPCLNECSECYNIIWNSVPLSLHDEKALIERLCPKTVRLQFTTEEKSKTREVLHFYEEILAKGSSKNLQMPFTEYTKGHLNRGVE